MITIIEKKEITAKSINTIIDQAIEILKSYELDAAEECALSFEKKEGFGAGEFSKRTRQRLCVTGSVNGKSKTDILVVIIENRSYLTGRYFYTVTAFED